MPGYPRNEGSSRGWRKKRKEKEEEEEKEEKVCTGSLLTEQKEPMGSPVNLLILLQLPGNGIRAPLLVLAVILTGLTALAAETPHDTPRERHARLTLFALPFHFCCSLLFSAQRKTISPLYYSRARENRLAQRVYRRRVLFISRECDVR